MKYFIIELWQIIFLFLDIDILAFAIVISTFLILFEFCY